MHAVDPVEPSQANSSLIMKGARKRTNLDKLDEDNNEVEVNHAEPNEGDGEANPDDDESEQCDNDDDDDDDNDNNDDNNSNDNNYIGNQDMPNTVEEDKSSECQSDVNYKDYEMSEPPLVPHNDSDDEREEIDVQISR